MDEQTYLYFLTALGEEYCEVISPLTDDGAEPQDSYEVFSAIFGRDGITPQELAAALSMESQLTRIRDVAREVQESDRISEENVREILRRVLHRWPADPK